jgi:thioredoxin reductase (NADPH)
MGLSTEELRRQAFPVLTEEQIALLRPFGEEQTTRAGDVLFAVGDTEYPLVIILEGQTAVIDRSSGTDDVLKTSGPGEFHAELGLLTGQTVFVSGVVREAGKVLLVPAPAVHEIIATIPVLSDILVTAFAARRQILMRSAAATLTVIGSGTSPEVVGIQEFADRNSIPNRWLAPDDPAAIELLAHLEHTPHDAVHVVVRGEQVLHHPSYAQIACAIGLDLAVEQREPADLLVVGTGPAGLAAAVYGASEGLTTIAVDDTAIGGQAGTSSRIENYLGFPTGISGGELAFRAEVQAIKFGARITVPRRATRLLRDGDHCIVQLDDTTELRGRSVIIATGARYRRLGLPRQDQFDGAGLYYAATELEARFCRNDDVIVVGGGNSAGQAAMFLAGTARSVRLVYRGPDLAHGMSQYLISRLEHAANVQIQTDTEVVELHGEARLEGVVLESHDGTRESVVTHAVFVMIGADPCTDWLRDTLDLDERGFVVTGKPGADGRPPLSPYETSLPGVFAVGDVRSGSVKRVASAVGEGSVVVQAVHAYLESIGVDEQEPITPASAA